jgi:hypothetical protein
MGQSYLDSLKGANPQDDQKAQQQFSTQIASIGAKNFQLGFPQDATGKLQTIGQEAVNRGVTPESLYQNQFDTPDLPFTVPKTVSAAESEQGFVGAVSHILTVPLTPVSKAWDWITSAQPGSTSLDKYLANVDQMRRDTDAANPGGVKGALAYGLPEAVGNIEAMAVGGGALRGALGLTGEAARLAPLASGFNRGMALFAGADASEETYHNAINDGATPTQALESAGVAGGINAAVMMSLGVVNAGALSKAMGDNAVAFEKGTYKPTVGEMTKYMAYDAAGNAATAATGQVGQNLFDRSTYDPDRPIFEGAADAAMQQSLFSLAHLPGLAKAFMGNAAAIKGGASTLADARQNLMDTQAKGDPAAIQVAQADHDAAQQAYADTVKTTAQGAEQPTMGNIDDAKAITTGEKPIPGTNPLADLNESLRQEAAAPVEGENEEPPTEQPTTDETPKEAAPTSPIQSALDSMPATKGTVESGVSAKPEGESTTESAATVAGEPEAATPAKGGVVQLEGKGTAPATHIGDQEQGDGKPPIPLFNLHEDIEGHPKGSTVSGDTLTKAGYDLPDTKEQAALRTRIMGALGADVPKAKIVFSTEHEHPAWADPAQPGKIFVNPDAMGSATKTLDEGFKDTAHGDEYIRRLMAQKAGEEVIHGAQHQIRPQHDLVAIHDATPEAERQGTIDRYGNDSIDATKGTTPEDIADRKVRWTEEHARQILQRKANGETTEDVWKQGAKPGLVRYFQALYNKIKAHISTFGDSTELNRYLKNIEGVLDDAQKSGQEVPKDYTGSQVSFAAKPLVEDAAPVRDGFYSHLERTIDAKMPGKASADQIRAMLKGNGVKDDEMKWSGIDDYLRKSVQENGQPTFSAKPVITKMDEAKQLGSDLKNKFLGLKKFGPVEKVINKFNADEQTKGRVVDETVKMIQKDVPNQLHDEGMALYIDAKGDIGQLAKWQKEVEKAPKTKENILYAKRLEAAQHLPPKALEWVNHINDNKALLRASLMKWGVNVGFVDNYITRMWKLDSTGKPIRNLAGRSLKSTFRFAGNRSIENSFEGWRQGLEPAEQRASVLWGHYMNEAMGVINARKFVAGANKEVMPDGKPMVSPDQTAKWVDVENPTGKARLVQKPFAWGQYADYRSLDLPAFTDWYTAGQIDGKKLYLKSDMFVHPDVYEKFHNLFANSKLSEWFHEPTTDPLEKALKLGTKFVVDDARKWIKGTLLGGFPAFHVQQESSGALGYGVNPIREALKSPIDTNDPRYQFAAEHGTQFFATQSSLHSYMEGYKASNSLFLEGLKNIPGIKDIGGKQLAAVMEASTDWTFKHFIPRLKLATFENILARNKATFSKELKAGTVTEDDLAYRASYDTNNAYGHLNYADLGRNATRQHLMNIVALAPDFWEARVRHALSATIGLTGSKANREQFRSFAILGGGLYIGARVLNQILDGDPHYEPENAFRIVSGNRSYQMRSYISDFDEMLTNTRTYFDGRMNPVARFVEEGATGVNYRGEKVQSSDIWRDLLAQAVPIPLQSLTRGLSATGVNSTVSPLEQFMGALGIKVSRFAPAQQIYPLAKAWNEAEGKPVDEGIYPTSQYTPLKYALEDGDFDQASQLYQKLVAADKGNSGKVARGLVTSLNASFTGSKADDMQFYKSLSDHDKLIYAAAVDRRHLLIQRFQAMLQQQNQKGNQP